MKATIEDSEKYIKEPSANICQHTDDHYLKD